MSIITKFEAYLLTEKRISKNTFEAYSQDLAQFLVFLKKRNIHLEKVTQDTIKSYLLYLKKNNISARSMSRKISSLKAFYLYAERVVGWKNHTEDILFPKIEKSLPHFLTEEEIILLLETTQKDSTAIGLRNRLILHLLYVSGMRITELTQLKITDIHMDTGFITIQGKGSKQRMIPLPQQTFELIRDYLTTTHKITSEKCPSRVEFLFPVLYAGKIKPISRQSCWIILKKLCCIAGINRNISPHQFRHSLATHLLKKGADLRSLQLWLGHESLTTVQIYTHVDTTFLRKIYDKKHPRS